MTGLPRQRKDPGKRMRYLSFSHFFLTNQLVSDKIKVEFSVELAKVVLNQDAPCQIANAWSAPLEGIQHIIWKKT